MESLHLPIVLDDKLEAKEDCACQIEEAGSFSPTQVHHLFHFQAFSYHHSLYPSQWWALFSLIYILLIVNGRLKSNNLHACRSLLIHLIHHCRNWLELGLLRFLLLIESKKRFEWKCTVIGKLMSKLIIYMHPIDSLIESYNLLHVNFSLLLIRLILKMCSSYSYFYSFEMGMVGFECK